MKVMDIVKKIISNFEIALASVMLVLLVVLTFIGVIMRYFFGNPFTWLEEIQLACMVWIVFSAAGATFRYGGHVAIEILVDTLPQKVQKIISILITFVVAFILIYFGVKSISYIQLFLKTSRGTPILKIPYALIYSIAPLSCGLMLINWFKIWIEELKESASKEEIL